MITTELNFFQFCDVQHLKIMMSWISIIAHCHRSIDNQNRWNVNVWHEIVNGYLIGPYLSIYLYIFDGNVIGENFLAFLKDDLSQLFEKIEHQTHQKLWIQLDGVPSHYTRYVRDYWMKHTITDGLDEVDPSHDLHDLLIWCRSTSSYENTWKISYMSKHLRREKIWKDTRSLYKDIAQLFETVRYFRDKLALCIQANGDNFEYLIR